jgi:hypothetical protein
MVTEGVAMGRAVTVRADYTSGDDGRAYAFSPIGYSGIVAGGGTTENAEYTTAVKHRVNIGMFRLSALSQFGGYERNNGSDGAWEAGAGGDFRIGAGALSVDATYDFNKDAVARPSLERRPASRWETRRTTSATARWMRPRA